MVKENLAKEIKDLENKKAALDKKISDLKIKQNDESSNAEWVKIPGTNLEVTKDVLHKGKSYNEIIKLKKQEEELLSLKMIGIICEHQELLKQLKMDSSSTNDDFFFKQPFPQNKENDRVAGFYADSDGAGLDCGYGSSSSGSILGVRFVRKTKGKK